jgi:hypothetical protein
MAKSDTDTVAAAAAAPIQGTEQRDQMAQSGEGTTAAEAGTDKPAPAVSSKKGGVTVRVNTPMIVNLTEDDAKKAGLDGAKNGQPPVTTYALNAGRNDNVPQVVADHWFVKANMSEAED